MKERRFDLAIIGAGSVGLIAAEFAAKLGARVVLLERDRIGGDCTWTGCVPSKALIRVAKTAHDMRTASRFGITSTAPAVNMADVRAYLRSTIEHIYAGTTPEGLQRKGIEVMLGQVSFVDRRTLDVGEKRIRAKNILIATGAQPVIPSTPGLSEVPFSTYRDIFENDRLPESMVVLGGGPIGVEVAQAYQRLGTRVTIFAERLLKKEEPEASAIVLRVLQREGITVVPERILSVTQTANRIAARSQNHQIEGDLLFVAAGRRPTLDGLNLEAAGVPYSERGIHVNDRLETSVPHIYAAGDVIGGEQFSHYAGWQGFQAARNALLPRGASGFASAMPRVTFCDPEVAQVGKTEADARAAHGHDTVVATWPIDRVDRAVTDDDRDGMMKIITKRDGTILGATIVGHRAGETIVEVVLAMLKNLRVSDLAGTIHAYPTYSSGIQLLASEMAIDHVLSGPLGMLIRAASKITR
jgi:pyruvate/2-oxoglutarate dehydrogenase complex dihydrolipoamide dehydrogenase (E3) component